MNDNSIQLKTLKAIFQEASFAPLFKRNPKHCVRQFANLTPYISYDDLRNNKYIIRGSSIGTKNANNSERRIVIVEYADIDELINDGWQLD